MSSENNHLKRSEIGQTTDAPSERQQDAPASDDAVGVPLPDSEIRENLSGTVTPQNERADDIGTPVTDSPSSSESFAEHGVAKDDPVGMPLETDVTLSDQMEGLSLRSVPDHPVSVSAPPDQLLRRTEPLMGEASPPGPLANEGENATALPAPYDSHARGGDLKGSQPIAAVSSENNVEAPPATLPPQTAASELGAAGNTAGQKVENLLDPGRMQAAVLEQAGVSATDGSVITPNPSSIVGAVRTDSLEHAIGDTAENQRRLEGAAAVAAREVAAQKELEIRNIASQAVLKETEEQQQKQLADTQAAQAQNDSTSAESNILSAYEIAKEGGRHAGFLKNYEDRDTMELEKGIASLQDVIAEHEAKISEPQRSVPDFDALSEQEQQHLRDKKWPADIARQKEQVAILMGIIDERS